MKKRFTVSLLISFFDELYIYKDDNIPSACVYFDFQKAFDRVDHNILLHKLRLIGFEICFVQRISSYLTDRYQSVRINDTISPSVHIPSGVPQSSMLGPRCCFSLYINDLPAQAVYSACYLFADDAKLNGCCSAGLQNDIDIFYAWSLQINMSLHPSKTKLLSFCCNLDHSLFI